MKRLPWMPLYCDDLIGSTADMSAEEFGAYVRLLCHIWTRGPIEMDDAVCCRVAGVKLKVWRRIRGRFDVCKRDDGTMGLSHPRLEREKMMRVSHAEERASSGRKGALARWKRGSADGSAIGSAYGKPMACHNQRIDTKSTVVPKSSAREAAPAPEGAGLPRLVTLPSGDEPDDATARNRAFIAAHRGKR
jgi:uncharacterized protein YdaU (DUF1376 family)